ncbi:MAG: glycosyl hydrolase [Planctomycetes bacterium]|jgi:photosystem II stability/assembly factor-like uncharacterized protein|nr:glycosyl hydrolase [Planctomycetota bacterium]
MLPPRRAILSASIPWLLLAAIRAQAPALVVEARFEPPAATSGQMVELVLTIQVPADHHVFGANEKTNTPMALVDSLLDLGSLQRLGAARLPDGEKRGEGTAESFLLRGTFELSQRFRVPITAGGTDTKVSGELQYQLATDTASGAPQRAGFAATLRLLAPAEVPQDPPGPVPSVLFDTLDWRLVGPFRGGRCAAVTGVPGQPDTYYFGSTGGGVWKTTDSGSTWQNVSDGSFGGSIGAVAVAPSAPNIVFVGGGEKTWRGNVSSGDGIWKSTDAGASWSFCGLADARHISRIRIHPNNPELVYAAVMGHVSGPNEERGVFRSKDGGKSWQRVHFVNAHAGAVDLCFQADDPNVLYATTWRAIRTPWSLESGGDGSGLWKSTDGGDSWTSLHDKPGLPTGTLGISGITSSPAKAGRLWAQIEAEQGGLFRSDDHGATWTKQNDERSLRQRAWYYTRVYADPKAADTVYVLNVEFHKSTDGGKTFTTIDVPHGDNHDLWLDPADPQRMIEGNDGGACVSKDGGKNWSSEDNQPTAQFYRVTTDDSAPYRIYAAQQDNSTVRIRHRGRGPGIARGDWEPTAGGESGWLAPKPGDAEIVFGGSYGGYLQRLDHRTGLSRRVDVWPDNPMGAGAEGLKYRFQWNFPILWSRHGKALYTAAQVLFRSDDEGASWQPISGDLTRNDQSKMGSSGGPITKDNTSVEYYGTIFTVDEGRVPGTIWTGSDDGLVHVTRDGGSSWQNVTPPGAPEWLQINCIAANPHREGGCYVAATRYKLDDFRPYLYATDDFGRTWREITAGLDPAWFTRCIRPDPVVPGMLYCGTERTVWLSFDDGRRWQRLQRNLPLVPITDLCIQDGSLIAATQGRSLWSFDGLPHLRTLNAAMAQQALVVFAPVPVVVFGADGDKTPAGQGENPDRDLRLRFFVGGDAEQPVGERVEVVVKDFDGVVVRTLASDAKEAADKIDVKRGMNEVRITWKSEPPKILDGMILWNGRSRAPRPAPGDYALRLTFGALAQSVTGTIRPDPRTTATPAELQARFRLVRDGNALVTEAHDAIAAIRSLRTQMATVVERADGDGKTRLEAQQKLVDAAITAVEEALYQTKSKSSQDPLNYPIRLTDKLLGVLSSVDGAEFGPTAGQTAVAAELSTAIRAELKKLVAIRAEQVAAFNALARELVIPHVK